jgi:hypothetical protein
VTRVCAEGQSRRTKRSLDEITQGIQSDQEISNEKLDIGIGVHSRGAANMKAVAGENIMALCDVDENYLAEAAGKYPQAKTYLDWRKMLDQQDIDAVKGMLLADYAKRILLPQADFKDFKPLEPWIAPSLGHHEEWIHACKTGALTLCNFDYSGALVEHNLLGTVALRAGKKLDWDPQNLKARNCPEADRFIRGVYREGWTL